MVIIAFSEKTSKILPRIICRRFKHCAPIVPAGRYMVLYQFCAPGHVTKIPLNMSGIRRLRANGWQFMYVPCDPPRNFDQHAFSCVDLSKRALGMRALHVQTPDRLFKHLCR